MAIDKLVTTAATTVFNSFEMVVFQMALSLFSLNSNSIIERYAGKLDLGST